MGFVDQTFNRTIGTICVFSSLTDHLYNSTEDRHSPEQYGFKSVYLLRVQQVIVEGLLLPHHGHVFVSSRVRISWSCSRLSSKQSVQVWSCPIQEKHKTHENATQKSRSNRSNNKRKTKKETPNRFDDDNI